MTRFSITLVMIASLCTSNVVAQPAQDWLSKGKELLNTTKDNNQETLLSDIELSEGLKQALQKGSDAVIAQLGSLDGFNNDPQIHIPLPDTFNKLNKVLKKLGYDSWTKELELKLNRAAEQATPQAQALFVNAISEMQLEDVKKIYQGEDDAATQYFKAKMSAPLAEKFKPIIDASLDEVGAIQLYEQMIEKYQSVPFVPSVKGNLSSHVIDKSLKGVFFYLAKEEAAIRQDPVKQTTALLKKLFSQ